MRMTLPALRGALLASTFLAAAALQPAAAQAPAMPTTAPGFTASVFTTGTEGMSHPDSLALVGHHLWIAYGNTAAPDGSSGYSNIVEYTMTGRMVRVLTVGGHNDGMRLDPRTGMIWAVQNEDGSPNLVMIDPMTGAQSAPSPLPAVNGGGDDDISFLGEDTFISASNPALNTSGINTSPAIIRVTRSGGAYVAESLLQGDAPAVNVLTGQPVTLNLTDPDSMIVTPEGDLLLDDQGDAQLILVHMMNGKAERVLQIPLAGGVQVDDTAYATASAGELFVSDTGANTVYRVKSSMFHQNRPYSVSTGVPATSTTPAIPAYVGHLDLQTGMLTPIVNGLVNPHGMVFRPTGG